MLAPSNPVVSVGAILAVGGIRGALRSTGAPVIGYSPIVSGKPLRGMADDCLAVIGVETTSEAVGRHYGARSATGLLDYWLVHEADRAHIPGVTVQSIPLLMSDPDATAAMVRAGLELAGVQLVSGDAVRWRRRAATPSDGAAGRRPWHRRARRNPSRPGLPEFRPGDDLATAIAAAAPWLRDRDVVVITSKVVSKCEGRIVDAPADPEERDALRRRLIDDEAVRVLARKGRTLITENRLGLVQAAAGVDGSNVEATELALLPLDPDASAAALRAALRRITGVDVAVVITDTMGRAWRNGQIDAAIGSSGVPVLYGYAGARDSHGNELAGHRGGGGRRDRRRRGSGEGQADRGAGGGGARAGPRRRRDRRRRAAGALAATDDLFWLGTAEAIELGRREAQLLRRSVRRFAAATGRTRR